MRACACVFRFVALSACLVSIVALLDFVFFSRLVCFFLVVNHCLDRKSPCDTHAICTFDESRSTHTCKCNDGYIDTGSGKPGQCVQIDPYVFFFLLFFSF